MNRYLVLCFAICMAGCAATGGKATKSCYHRNESVETDIGYCQAVRSGNTLYISGIVGQGDMAAATRSVYERLQKTLEANGLKFADVVKENVYTTDLEAFEKAGAVRKEFYGTTFPAATWVQVQRLFSLTFVLDVELTATYP